MSDVQRLREAEMLDITDHDRRGMVRAVILPCEWSVICDVLEAAEDWDRRRRAVTAAIGRQARSGGVAAADEISTSLARLHDQLEAQS